MTTDSSRNSQGDLTISSQPPERPLLDSAMELATALVTLYPSTGKVDEMYVKGLAAVFMAYPTEWALRVIDPVKGLPSTNKFLPAIAEVKSALDAMRPAAPAPTEVDRLEFLRVKQLEERIAGEKWEAENPVEKRQEFIRKHWTEGARKEHNPLPKLEGWQERGKAYLQQNTPAEKLMNMGLFDPKNRGARWE